MKIIEKFKEVSGKWTVRVLLTELRSEFFYFADEPTDYKVEQIVNKFLLEMSEEEFNDMKPPMLKLIENEYCDFIKSDWNTTLKKYGIIPEEYEITIENTNEIQNIQYLLTLKRYNKEDYYKMAGEFDRYKRVITENGGLMSRVKLHQ